MRRMLRFKYTAPVRLSEKRVEHNKLFFFRRANNEMIKICSLLKNGVI